MTISTLTLENLKIQARRMRDHFAEKNIDISHSATLEVLAKQHGFKDWNVLSAILKRRLEKDIWPELDDRIKGIYLGHNFTGRVTKIQITKQENSRRYTLLFDNPVDVVTSAHFSNSRRQINCFLDQSLKSVDHKGRPDNIVQLL